MRSTLLETGEIYHVFNRGLDRRNVFISEKYYSRAVLALDYYSFTNQGIRLSKLLQLNLQEKSRIFSELNNTDKRVDIISYCLMPNHFHILLRQRENNGISKFVSDFANSYTRYFNTRQDKRLGALFEGRFKSVHIEDENQLLHVHRYIHINPAVSYIVKSDDLENYRWSSLPEYMDIVKDDICEKQTILSNFSSVENYKSFIFDQIDYARHLKNVKHLLLD